MLNRILFFHYLFFFPFLLFFYCRTVFLYHCLFQIFHLDNQVIFEQIIFLMQRIKYLFYLHLLLFWHEAVLVLIILLLFCIYCDFLLLFLLCDNIFLLLEFVLLGFAQIILLLHSLHDQIFWYHYKYHKACLVQIFLCHGKVQ